MDKRARMLIVFSNYSPEALISRSELPLDSGAPEQRHFHLIFKKLFGPKNFLPKFP